MSYLNFGIFHQFLSCLVALFDRKLYGIKMTSEDKDNDENITVLKNAS